LFPRRLVHLSFLAPPPPTTATTRGLPGPGKEDVQQESRTIANPRKESPRKKGKKENGTERANVVVDPSLPALLAVLVPPKKLK
jgi:hypothetical protein